MLHHHFTFKLNISYLILNYNAVKIDSLHYFCIYTYKTMTFQILYHLLNTLSLLSFISHYLALTKHLRILYLLSLSL